MREEALLLHLETTKQNVKRLLNVSRRPSQRQRGERLFVFR